MPEYVHGGDVYSYAEAYGGAPLDLAQAAVTADGAMPIVDEPTELTIWAAIPGGMDDYTNNPTTQWFEEKTGVHINWIEVANAESATLFNTSIASGD